MSRAKAELNMRRTALAGHSSHARFAQLHRRVQSHARRTQDRFATQDEQRVRDARLPHQANHFLCPLPR
ncbi:MAG: hypothetical protein ACK559_35375, partial [bacterium]